MDSEAVPQAIEDNLANSTQRVSHSPVWFVTFATFAKAFGVAKLCLMLVKYCKTFDSS